MEAFSVDFTIDLRRLRVLRELQQRGTVAATAQALHLTSSAVSQKISSLSRETGVPLLVPQGRRVRLTPQANLLLEHGAVIEAQMERARADLSAFHAGHVGRVAIGAFATAIANLVAPTLTKLRKTHPRLSVSVREVDAPDCFTRLDTGDLDLVLSVDYPSGPVRHDPRYSRRDLLLDPFLAALPARHPLGGRKSVDLDDLADLPWIMGGAGGPCCETSLGACTSSGFSPDVKHRTNDWLAALALVAAGCGVALVPRLALPPLLPKGVALKPLSGPHHPNRHLYAVIRAGSDTLPSLVPVLEAIQETAARLRRCGDGDRGPRTAAQPALPPNAARSVLMRRRHDG